MFELENPKEFAFAGNAIITLESENTKNHFTYRIRRSKNDEYLYFIDHLHGPDNINDYSYIGCYYLDRRIFVTRKNWKTIPVNYWPPSVRAMDFFLEHLDKIPPKLHVYHEGRCGRCGRRLTTPESIKRGLGPECCKLGERL